MLQAYLDGSVFGTSVGDGDASVVLLHGWRRDRSDFDATATQLLARGYASVALDLPGFGSSPPPTHAMGARGYADVLAPLVRALAATNKPVLVGHSFGGRVATCLAASYPDCVAGLVLTGVPLVRAAMPKSTPSRRYQMIRRLSSWHLLSADRLEAARRRYGSSDYRHATGVMRDVLVTNINESYEDELAALRAPVSFVWGANDATTPLAVARAAMALVPASTLDVLDGVGHLVPTDAPPALVNAACSLLDQR